MCCLEDGLRCCSSTAACCPASPYCKRLTTDVCCSDMGTCPSGYFCHSLCECVETGGTCCSNGRFCATGNKCCSLGGCAPVGGECCANGRMCDTGNICVYSSTSGKYGCCTDLKCTAYESAGATITYTTTSQIATVAPPATTKAPVIGKYYYWTITWYFPLSPSSPVRPLLSLFPPSPLTTPRYYYYYYFTYYDAIEASTLTSSRTSTVTRISVYETLSSDAEASLSSMSSSLSSEFSTPAGATSALGLSTDRIGGKTTTSSSSSSSLSTSSSVDGAAGNGGGGNGNGGVSAGRVQASLPGRGLVWGLVGGAVAVGAGMVWL